MNTTILLSGGLDSTALAFWRRPTHALTVDYGQISAPGEIRAATRIAQALQLEHEVIHVDCRSLGSGDLAGSIAHPIAPVPEWWPFRNQLLVTLGAMHALRVGAGAVLVGSVFSDAAHADGTADFYHIVDKLTSAQEGGIRVLAPALELTTAQLVQCSNVPRSLLAWAHSCHIGEYACGHCRGCQKHMNVTEELWGHAY